MKNFFTYRDICEITLVNVNLRSVTLKITFEDDNTKTCLATRKVANKLLHRYNDLACCDELVFGFVGDNFEGKDQLWLAALSKF